jgi:hypothetical protein
MRIGGVKLERGKIVELKIDSVPSPPVFDANEEGAFTFSLSDRVLRFNDGEKLVGLNTTVSEDPNLKASLGSNWLNDDLSFNPVPFNALPGISGLSSNDSLFDVIDQITTLIDNVSTISLSDIVVPGNPPEMSVVAYLSGDLIMVQIDQALEGSTFSLTFDNLRGFDITDTTEGNMVLFNDSDELVSKKTHYTYENLTESDAHLVTHNLGILHCGVFCIDPSTNTMLTPQSVTFTTTNQLVINLTEAKPLKAFIYNFEPI